MPSTYKLRHFSNPATLKNVSRQMLVAFLEPYRDFLSQRGFDLQDSDAFDYDALASILMTPDDNTPEKMLDALCIVDEMSVMDFFDTLRDKATEANINLEGSDEISASDLAMRVWMERPDILEKMHAERFMTKARSFQTFLANAPKPPDPVNLSPDLVRALENDLNDWFVTQKRGRGTRVFPFIRENYIWFLVRHGEPFKREGTIKDDKPSSIYYRPEKFDVLVYNSDTRDLAIHADTKGAKQAYCKIFGLRMFGSEAYFDIEGRRGRFSLQPIITDGRACLACNDIEGIEEIRLAELHFKNDSEQNHEERHKADDVFLALEERGSTIPPQAVLQKAGFKVKFSNSSSARTVVIRPPDKTIYERDSDAEILRQWMINRGFIIHERAGQHADDEEVLEVR